MKLSWTSAIGLTVMLGTVAAVVVISVVLGRDASDRSIARLIEVVVVVVAIVALAPIVNGYFRRGHLLRRARVLDANREIVWLADIDMDAHTASVLSGRDATTTFPKSFVLTAGPVGLQFWVDPYEPEFTLAWGEVIAVEVAPPSRSLSPGPDLVIDVGGDPVLLDIVGPLWGTLPCPRRRVADIAAEITMRSPGKGGRSF